MNFNNILFPVDFSDSSLAVKSDVEWLAKKFNSNVTLLHVFEIPPAWYGMGDAYAVSSEWLTELMDESRKRLDAFPIDLPAPQVNRVLLEGRPAAEIHTWCQNHDVDLVAMATHGHGAFEGLMMGSVTAKVLHNIHLPLWLRPQEVENAAPVAKFHIVCGIDLAEESAPILKYARHLAEDFDATVTLLHSVPEQETRPNKYLDFDLHRVLKGIAEKEIESLQKKAGTAFPLVITGKGIGTALAEVAKDQKANLVLIGRGHSHRFLGRFRTHAFDLLSQVTCPVFSYCADEATVVPDALPLVAVSV